MWAQFIFSSGKVWHEYFLGWLLESGDHPVLIVWFEDLKANVTTEVKRMLDFLKVPYSESELEKRLENNFEKFHRKQRDQFQHYTPGQRYYLRTVILKTIDILKKANFTAEVTRLENYLPPMHYYNATPHWIKKIT